MVVGTGLARLGNCFSRRLGPALYNAWSNPQPCHHPADELPNPSGSLGVPTACSPAAGWVSPHPHPLPMARGWAAGKVFRQMPATLAPAGANNGLIPTHHIGWKGFSLFLEGGRAGRELRDMGFGWLLPCVPVPLHAATSGRSRCPAGTREPSLFLF